VDENEQTAPPSNAANTEQQAGTMANEDQTSQAGAQQQDPLAEFWAAGGTFGMALRDGLASVQLEGSGAARASSEHVANLLYGVGNVEQHTAPYTGRDYPNPNDYRDRDTNAAARRRR
jgi:hypothetical protein